MKRIETNERLRSFNDIANFYLSKIYGKEKFVWELVAPRRMLEISYLLKREDVMDRIVDQLDELDVVLIERIKKQTTLEQALIKSKLV